MTEERWRRIAQQMEMGDPLKDIDCTADELITYCFELRLRLYSAETCLHEWETGFINGRPFLAPPNPGLVLNTDERIARMDAISSANAAALQRHASRIGWNGEGDWWTWWSERDRKGWPWPPHEMPGKPVGPSGVGTEAQGAPEAGPRLSVTR